VDLTVLKKKISSYRTPAGQIRNLPNELLAEILHAWEQWTGSAKSFYQELETNQKKLAGIIGKGAFDGLNFTEVIIEGENEASNSACSPSTGCNIELVYQNNVIRFGSPDLLLDFLKKAA
jgi:hypothetical protein